MRPIYGVNDPRFRKEDSEEPPEVQDEETTEGQPSEEELVVSVEE